MKKYVKEIQMLALGLIILGAFSLSFSTFTPTKQLAAISGAGSNLVLYYPFDDGTATDQSGSGNSGAVVGAVPASTAAVGNGALTFDGVSNTVNGPTNSILNSTTLTISMWVKLNAAPTNNNGSLIQKGGSGGWRIRCGSFSPCTPQLLYGGNVAALAGSALTLGTWTHIVATLDGTGSQIFINGVAGSKNATAYTGTGGSSVFNIDDGIAMSVDDVRIYSVVLGQTDINSLFALGNPAGNPGTGGGGSTPTTYTLSVTNQNSAGGSVTSNPAGINCGSTCSLGSITSGASVSLTATPNSGFTTVWTGCSSSNGNTCSVTVSSNTSVSVNFTSTGGGGTPPATSYAAEVEQFSDSVNTSIASGRTTIRLTNGVSAGTTAVILLGFEDDNTQSLVSVSDSKGNSWRIQNSSLINTVHQMAVATAFMSSALTTSDTITLVWGKTVAKVDLAGDLLSIAAGSSSNVPNANILKNTGTYNDIVVFPGQTTVANTVLVGIVQTDNPITYSGPNANWTLLGNAKLGVSGSTVGLNNAYLYGYAATAGTYDPGGTWGQNKSWQGIWLAFPSNGATIGGGGSTPTPVAGVCSTSVNICTAGTFSDLADTSTNYQWQCLGVNGGANSNTCTAAIPATPVNGSCSATLNQCTAGTFTDQTDTATNYLWQCTGASGGTNASCSQAIPVTTVNGICGASTNQCTSGTFTDQTDTASQNLWQCTGSGGGTTASCATAISSGGTPGTYYVDFQSGNDVNDGLTTGTAWKHSPGDANATGAPKAKTLQPGNTVIFKGGTVYSGEIDIPASGTAGSPITFRGNTTSGTFGTGKALFDLLGTIQHAFYGINKSYINIDNVDIYNAQNQYNSSNVPAGSCPAGQAKVTRGGVDQCITYSGVDNVYKGFITMRGGNNWVITNSIMHEVANYTDVCILDAESDPDNSSIITPPADNAGINLYGTTGSPVRNVLIDNVEIFATGRDLMDLAYTDGIEIRNSDFGGINRGSKAGWFAVAFREGETLGVKGSGVPSVWIHDNRIHDGWQYQGDEAGFSNLHGQTEGIQRCHAGDWIHSYGTSGNVVGLKIERNFMYNNHRFNVANGTGNSFIESNNYDVSWLNNIIVNAQHVGIKTAGVQNMTIQGNVIITWPMALSGVYPNIGYSAPVYIGVDTLTPTNIHIKNNVFVTKDPSSNTNPLEFYDGANSIPIEQDYNMYDSGSAVSISVQKGAGPNLKTTFTLPTWKAIFPSLDAHSVEGKGIAQLISVPSDPSQSGSGDYRPVPGSATEAILSGSTGGSSSPINGQCGSTANICTSGIFSDQTDTATNALWQCIGSLGGSTASCSLPITSAFIPGDFNHDGSVNSLDMSSMATAWNTTNSTYDLNGDGRVNTLDYVIMVKNWTN